MNQKEKKLLKHIITTYKVLKEDMDFNYDNIDKFLKKKINSKSDDLDNLSLNVIINNVVKHNYNEETKDVNVMATMNFVLSDETNYSIGQAHVLVSYKDIRKMTEIQEYKTLVQRIENQLFINPVSRKFVEKFHDYIGRRFIEEYQYYLFNEIEDEIVNSEFSAKDISEENEELRELFSDNFNDDFAENFLECFSKTNDEAILYLTDLLKDYNKDDKVTTFIEGILLILNFLSLQGEGANLFSVDKLEEYISKIYSPIEEDIDESDYAEIDDAANKNLDDIVVSIIDKRNKDKDKDKDNKTLDMSKDSLGIPKFDPKDLN